MQSPVVLVCAPGSCSGTGAEELGELRALFSTYESSEVELLAIYVDSKFTQAKFAEDQGYGFQLLADCWPHGFVTQLYDVFLEDRGHATRGTFVISKSGELVAKFITSPGEPRDLESYKKALELL